MKPLTKNLFREIKASRGRFIAIILIILLGSLIFVGVRATGPVLNQSMTSTIQRSQLSDVQLLSNTGFTNDDVRAANSVSDATAEANKFTYATGGSNAAAVALYGYSTKTNLNRLVLRTGHLPQRANQIVLDNKAKTDYDYRLGQHFTFSKNKVLQHRTFTIVGFVDSPQYIDNGLRGVTNVGDGTVRFFAAVPSSQLKMPASLLSVRFKSLQGTDTYSNHYVTARNRKLKQLKTVLNPRAEQHSRALYINATKQLNDQLNKLTAAKVRLQAAQQEVTQTSGGTMTSTPELTNQLASINAAQSKLTSARNKIKQQTKTHYTWQNRSDLPGFSSYGESSERIAAIANVFPVFFFLIAALITFTTITRMVEEARAQIGTFKALGYGKWAIARNYLAYALMAGTIGGVIGSLLGNETIPRFVLALYSSTIPMSATVRLEWSSIILALCFSLIATVGAAGFVVWRELQEGPAALMLPKPPKSAKRILLERITPLWQRLNFNQKVSYRNLFRYKSRMVMSIVGIAGGCALILCGFGIRDSITAAGNRQYRDIVRYQAVISLHGADADISKTQHLLQQSESYQKSTPIAATTAKVRHGNESVSSVNVFIPQTTDFANYVRLTTPGGSNIVLPQRGAVLSQKTATLLGAQVGDSINVNLTSATNRSIKVAAITKNYIGDYLYLSPAAYQHVWHKTSNSNALLVKLNAQSSKQRNRLAHQLLQSGAVRGTSFVADQRTTIDNMSATLDPVVVIFIVMSGLLSFVVMYNLTNINVSERIRELSTVKVLGFYDREVTMYVARENIVLTIVGVILGYGIGNALTWYILKQATTAQVMFPLVIHWSGYIIAAILMALFTAIVIWFTHRRLKRVDMVSALKATD